MENLKISIPYKAIVKSLKICEELRINEHCVNEGRIDGDAMLEVTITKENKWILDELKNLIY